QLCSDCAALIISFSSRTLLPLIFFFSCSAHHRDLHSFPTRRSSDLFCSNRENSESASAVLPAKSGVFTVRRCWPDIRSAPLIHRSEEHTSELQSLAYLVCRLLLEKKKHQKRR